MKKILSLAIILSTSAAFATRARVSSLGNAAHLVDTALIQGNVSDIMLMTDSATIETGITAATSTTDGAEGTVIKSMGDAKVAVVLGQKGKRVTTLRKDAAAAVTLQQNPISVIYGMKMNNYNVAAGLDYSKFNNKTTGSLIKEDSMSLNLGAQNDMYAVSIALGLVDTVKNETANTEYKGKSNTRIEFNYNVSPELFTFLTAEMYAYDNTITAAKKSKMDNYEVGVIHTMKKDGSELFYGASLQSQKTKIDGGDTTTNMYLPLIIGLEADAASWFTMRGSITQKVLINSEKTENNAGTTTAELDPAANSTTAAFGGGLKLNKVTIDGSLMAGGSQNLNFGAGNLLTQVGLTYNF